MHELAEEVKSFVRDIPDFPKAGILFRDITPVLQNGPTLLRLIDYFKARYAGTGVNRIAAIESRGFIFGTALAYALGLGVALVRKPGKLPYHRHSAAYTLEYGSDSLEMHVDAIHPGEKVVIMDDLLATGGTAHAACTLVETLGGQIHECAFVIEISGLNGRSKLVDRPLHSLLRY